MPSSASSCGRGLAPSDGALHAAVAEQPDERDRLHLVLLRELRLLVDVHLDDLVGALRASRRSARRSGRPAGTARTTAPRSRRSPACRCAAPRRRTRGGHRPHRRSGGGSGSGSDGCSPARTASSHACASCDALQRDLSGPSGTPRTTIGTSCSIRSPREIAAAAATGIIGSSVPCCTSTGIDRAASQSTSTPSDVGQRTGSSRAPRPGARASTAASASASASPPPCENPPTIASARGEAVLRALVVEQVVELVERVGERRVGRRRPAAIADRGRNHGEPGRRATGPRGRTARKRPSGSRYGQQAAEVVLVGAVAVDEQEHALRGGRSDDVVDQSHGRLAKLLSMDSIAGVRLGPPMMARSCDEPGGARPDRRRRPPAGPRATRRRPDPRGLPGPRHRPLHARALPVLARPRADVRAQLEPRAPGRDAPPTS